MSFPFTDILAFVGAGIACLFLIMLLAPLEALGWWAGWYEDDPSGSETEPQPLLENQADDGKTYAHYIVFLDGIAKATPENYDDVQRLLDRIANAVPEAAVLGDVVPYAVSGTPLTDKRPLSRFWQFARERKLQDATSPVGFFINLRNLFQVLVSADKRYSPIYHYGQSQTVIADLLKYGYKPGSGVPITLIGFSGGAQVAAGVAPYLKHLMRAPVDLISLGGVISADPGLLEVRYLYHFAGSKDFVEKLSTLIFPGRWTWFVGSSWNRAKRRGKFAFIPLGPMNHNGKAGYLDEETRFENGQSYAEHTASMISQVLNAPEMIRIRYLERYEKSLVVKLWRGLQYVKLWQRRA